MRHKPALALALTADPAYAYDELLHGWQATMRDHGATEVALHAVLLQGVVPDSIIPYSASAVLGPAWSLTLEWQFYLVAPAFVWLVARDTGRMAFTLAVAALALGGFVVAQRKGLLKFLESLPERLGFATPWEALSLKDAAGNQTDPTIVINADAKAPHQSVINVMEAARRAGYGRITFTTQSQPK